MFLNVRILGGAVASFLHKKRCRKTKKNYQRTVSDTYLCRSMRKKSWKWGCKPIEPLQSVRKPTSAHAFHIISFVSSISRQLDSEGVEGCSQRIRRYGYSPGKTDAQLQWIIVIKYLNMFWHLHKRSNPHAGLLFLLRGPINVQLFQLEGKSFYSL